MSSCKPFIYVENISNVIYTEGVVRMELTARTQGSTLQKDGQESLAAVDATGCLVMSLPALLRLSEQLEKTMSDMAEKGILSKKETQETSSQ